MLETLREEHERLLALADQLKAMMAEASLPDADRFSRLRWSFTSQLMRHVMAEDRLIYGPLRQDGQPVHPTLVNVDAPLLRLRDDLEAHNREWAIARAFAHWEDYCAALRVLLDRMVARIAQEEEVFFPLLEAQRSRPAA